MTTAADLNAKHISARLAELAMPLPRTALVEALDKVEVAIASGRAPEGAYEGRLYALAATLPQGSAIYALRQVRSQLAPSARVGNLTFHGIRRGHGQSLPQIMMARSLRNIPITQAKASA